MTFVRFGQPEANAFLEVTGRTRSDERVALIDWANRIGLEYDFRDADHSPVMSNATGCNTQTSSGPTGTTDDHNADSDDWGDR